MDEITARKRETFKGLELTEATTLGELCARFNTVSIEHNGSGAFPIKPGKVVLLDENNTVRGVMPLESFKRDFVTAEPEDDLGLG